MMVGLVFVDTLVLTFRQHLTLCLILSLCLYVSQRHNATTFYTSLSVGLIQSCLLLWGFWDVILTKDVLLFFQSVSYLQKFTWAQFLTEFAHRDYVKLQPPFFTFFISRCPHYLFQQLIFASYLLIGLPLLVSMYGKTAYFVAATPIYNLALIQPSTDTALFWWLVVTFSMLHSQKRRTAAIMYGLSFLIKPLSILLFPVMLFYLRCLILFPIVIVFSYWMWSRQFYFGVKQWAFLAHQTFVSSGKGHQQHVQQASFWLRRYKKLRNIAFWRWEHLGRNMASSLWWYLAPLYSTPRLWIFWGMTCIIVFGYGNVKYLLIAFLTLPFKRDA